MPKQNLIDLDSRILGGLAEETAVWGQKYRQLDYYDKDNAKYIGKAYDGRRKVASYLTYQVVNELGKWLYSPGPFRVIRNSKEADDYYQTVVKSNDLNSKFQRGDELSTLHGAFALQISPSDDPGKPLKVYTWSACEFYPYFQDDDPSVVWAVLVRSIVPLRQQVRYQLFSDTEVRTYWSKPGDDRPLPNGVGRELTFESSVEHGLGCLPFVFLHAKPPVMGFYEGELGRALCHINHIIDTKQSDLAHALELYSVPRSYAINVSSNTEMREVAGSPTHLVGDSIGTKPELFFLQPNIDVESAWLDIDNLINRALVELDIPLQVRIEQSAPESGTAQLVRRMSLITRNTSRMPQWEGYEKELAGKILTIGGFREEADKLDMTVDYPVPALSVAVTQNDQDLADKFALDNGLKSRVQIIAERRGITREEAREVYREIQEDNGFETSLIAG